MRADHEPRARLRRLAARARSAPEQHARRGRPPPRPPGAGRANGQHDGALHGAPTARASRSLRARRAGRGCARRCSSSSPASSTRGYEPQAAVERPRLHRVGSLVHLEPGWSDEAVAALGEEGYEVRIWPESPPLLRRCQRRREPRGRRGPATERRRDGVVTRPAPSSGIGTFRPKNEAGEESSTGAGGGRRPCPIARGRRGASAAGDLAGRFRRLPSGRRGCRAGAPRRRVRSAPPAPPRSRTRARRGAGARARPEPAAVEVAVEVEQEGLDPQLLAPVMRIRANRDRRPMARGRARVDPRRRDQQVRIDSDVRRRIPERAAARVAGDDDPLDLVRAARAATRRLLDLARRGAASGSGRTRSPRRAAPSARRTPRRGAARDRPRRPRPNRKFSPATIDLGPDRPRHPLSELLRLELRDVERELDDERILDAALRDQLEAPLEGREAARPGCPARCADAGER